MRLIWAWILGILAILLLLLWMTRITVRIRLGGSSVTVEVRAAGLRVWRFPGKKQEPKPGGEKLESAETKKRIPHITRAALAEGIRTLWPPLKRALLRLGRGIRISPLELRVTLGGAEDPAGTAELYGMLHTAVWTGMPILERALDIREPHLHIGLDFDAVNMTAEGEIGVKTRVGTLLRVGLGIGIPALRWLLRQQNREKQQAGVSQPAA